MKLLQSVSAFALSQSGALRVTTTLAATASFTITQLASGDATAPYGAWFTVADLDGFAVSEPVASGNVYDPTAHDITWIWDFDDTGAAPDISVNLPTAWKDTNKAYGKMVAHTFASAGTYNVSCFGVDAAGNHYTATTEVVVASADAFAPGTRTICLNPTGDTDFTGKPTGAQESNSWADTVIKLQALGNSQPSRVLFKRGATYSDWPVMSNVFYMRNFRLGAYGTGARPILKPAEEVLPQGFVQARFTSGGDIVIEGLDFQGWWDSVTETGVGNLPINLGLITVPATIHNCRFDGWAYVDGGFPDTQPMSVLISNCEITNWQSFGFFCGPMPSTSSRVGFVGTSMHQSEEALHGFFDAQQTLIGNAHSSLRIPYTPKIFMSACSCYARNGWSFANAPSGLKPKTAANPPLRINTSMNASYNSSHSFLANFERCYVEGGYELVNMTGQNTGEVDRPGNYIFDKMLLVASPQTERGMNVQFGGTTIRNSLFFNPSIPSLITGFADAIQVKDDTAGTPDPLNAESPIKIYSNTVISLTTTVQQLNSSLTPFNPNVTDFSTDGDFDVEVFDNNTLHAPNQDIPSTAFGPFNLATAIPGVQTLFRGARWSFQPITGTLGSAVANNASFTVAYPNDSATHPAGAATNQAYFDANPGDTKHVIAVKTVGTFRAAFGQFELTFGASNITVTNRSGVTWTSGVEYTLVLDRTSRLMAMDTTYNSPTAIPLPTPDTGSSALNGYSTGLLAQDDLLGNFRSGKKNLAGSVVSGTAEQGAVEA